MGAIGYCSGMSWWAAWRIGRVAASLSTSGLVLKTPLELQLPPDWISSGLPMPL